MEKSAEYSIPVPMIFRCPPLAKLPWGITAVPGMLRNSAEAESLLREKLQEKYQVKHCILTDSARSAYAVYIDSQELSGEVIMSSFMHTPTAVLFMNRGLELVFSDVAQDFNMTLDQIKPLVTDKTSAIMVTHMFGKVAAIEEIEAWAKPKGIRVLSNMVHMHPGVELDERPLASHGNVAFISFNMDKPLHGLYGGALLTNSDEVFEKASAITTRELTQKKVNTLLMRYLLLYRYKPLLGPLQYLAYTLKGKYYNRNDVDLTFNSLPADDYEGFIPSRMHPWQAAVTDALLDLSEAARSKSEALASMVSQALNDLPGVETPIVDSRPNTFLYYPIIIDSSIDRYALGCALTRRGVESKWRYYPLHLQHKFKHFSTGDLSNTESLWKSYLLLPVLYGSEAHAKYVVQALRAALDEIGEGK